MRLILTLLALLWSAALPAAALELKPVRITGQAYAVVGDLSGQTYENDGLNANLGFVIGDNSVLVINSGPSRRVAAALHAAIRKLTDKPVKWVVNVNSQNHYWHGNGYFKEHGAKVIAHTEALRLMHEQGAGQLESNKDTLKEKAAGTALAYPDETFIESKIIALGAIRVELRHFGNAHTPGDIVVWLPESKTLFTGDLGFSGRLLAILPIGSTSGWVSGLERLNELAPRTVIPGHGRPGTLAEVNRDTRDYLVYLRAEAKRVFDSGGSLQDAVDKIDQSRFRRLLNYDLLARRNVNILFQEIEREAF